MSLILDHVNYIYGGDTALAVHALKDVNLVIPDGQFIGLIGHTGSGKSTLVQHLNGLIKPTSGSIYYNGEDIHAEDYDKKKLRSKVGLVFQYPEHQLFEIDVFKDVCFGPKNLGLSKQETELRAYAALKQVGIEDQYFYQSPFDLSGGQKRRVAIAGVLAMKPEILILDEPTAGLDPSERIRFRNLISELASDRIVLLSTHIVSDVESAASQIILMKDGKFLVTGTAEELIASCPDRSWICDVSKGEVLACHQKYRVANVKTLADHAQLRILSKDSPMPGAVQEEASLEDVFLSYFGERSGDGNGMV